MERNPHGGFKIRHLLACLDSVRRHPGMETDVVFPITCSKMQPSRATVILEEREKRTPQSEQIKKKNLGLGPCLW